MSSPPKKPIQTTADLVAQLREREALRRAEKPAKARSLLPNPSPARPAVRDLLSGLASPPPSEPPLPPSEPPPLHTKPRKPAVHPPTRDLLTDLVPPQREGVINFPTVWTPGPQRMAPVCLLRSAVFGVMPRGKRQQFHNHPLAALPGFTLTFTGTQLDQFDLDVWLQAVDIAKQNGGLGVKAEFTAYGFLQAIGRSPRGKSHHERLHESLTRMVACALRLSTERFEYVGNLLDFTRDRALARYSLTLNPKLVRLFADGSAPIDWERRRLLRKDVSRWLHGYLASQAPGSYTVSVASLQQLCGSTAKPPEWRRILRGALEELRDVGALKKWRLDRGDALLMELPPGKLP